MLNDKPLLILCTP